MYNFEINKVYRFNTTAPAFLGARIEYANCLIAAMHASQARLFSPIDQTWAKIFPTLPSGIPNRPEAATYALFQGRNGSRFVMADVWIDEGSIETIEHVTITIVLPEASLQDINPISQALNAAGFRGKYSIQAA